MFTQGFLVVWLVLTLVGALSTAWLVRRVWKGGKLAPSASKWLVALVVGSATWGVLGTLLGIVKAFGAVGGESVDPSQRARILAEGLGGAIDATVLGLIVWLPSGIALLVMTRARKATAERI